MKRMLTLSAPGLRLLALAGTLLAVAPAALAQQPAVPVSPPPAALGSPAQPATGPYSLQRAIDYALQHNLSVRQNELNARSVRTTLAQSKAALLPSANLNGNQNWNYGTNINPVSNQFISRTIRSNNLSGQAQVVVFQGFQLRNTIRRNDLDYQASLRDIDKARNDLSLNVASAYLQMLLGEELMRANQTRVASSQAQVARTQVLLKAGSVAEGNLLDSQSQLASDELNVVTATNQRDVARLNLVQYMNLDAASARTFEVEVPALADPDEEVAYALNLDEINQTAARTLPEIVAADLRVQSAHRNVDLVRGGYFPRLTLGGAVSSVYSSANSRPNTDAVPTFEISPLPIVRIDPLNPTGPPIPTDFRTVNPRVEFLPTGFLNQLSDNFGRTVQFTLTVPVLNGLQVRTGVQRALINEELSHVRADQARLTLRQSIEQAFLDARAAQLQYAAAKRQVTALTLSQRNAEIRFNNGLLNGTDFNIARNNLAYAESSRIQAKYSFIFRRKVLDFYQGKPLTL